MYPPLEALLVLQARDQRIAALEAEEERIPREEAALDAKLKNQLQKFEQLKAGARQLETDRKKLELEVNTKKDQIARYKSQQFQTKKNEEYSALTHEIERAEADIVALEDRELELMAQFENAQKQIAQEQIEAKKLEAQAQQAKADLAKKKSVVEAELATARAQQKEAEGKVDEADLRRYRRILASKKDAAIVPIEHGVSCGGCHMKLTHQTVLSAKGAEALVACENCGRLIYWSE